MEDNTQELALQLDECVANGENQKALEIIDLLLENLPKKTELNVIKAHIHNELEEYEKAIESCNIALKTLMTNPEVYFERGYA